MTDNNVILPKLLRRTVAFLETNAGIFDAKKFLADLKKGNERVLLPNKLRFTHFDDLIEVDPNGKIRLREAPEELVFLE